MASLYEAKGKRKWYISYIDPDTGKVRNKSTGLDATRANRKKAEELKKEVEELIENRKNLYKDNDIQRATIREAFRHFLDLNFDKHPKTQLDYKRFIGVFAEHFDIDQPCTVINKISVEKWIIHVKKKIVQPNTQYNYYKVLNKFLNFLFEYSYIPVFKVNKGLKPKVEVKEIIIFEDGDVEKILEGLNQLEKTSNFKTMIYMLLYTGLRPSDILEVKVKDINLEEMTLQYYSPKTKQYLIVPLHDELKDVLKTRIREVGEGRIFNYATIGEMGKAFRRFLKKLELTGKGYNLRTFRKHFATKAFENDIQPFSAAKLLGHRNISTTMKYYTKAQQKKLASELKKMKFKDDTKNISK